MSEKGIRKYTHVHRKVPFDVDAIAEFIYRNPDVTTGWLGWKLRKDGFNVSIDTVLMSLEAHGYMIGERPKGKSGSHLMIVSEFDPLTCCK
jgi:hypothetical protein